MKGYRGRPPTAAIETVHNGPRCPGCGLLLDGLDCKAAGRCQARENVWGQLPAIGRLFAAMDQDARTETLTRGRDEARKATRSGVIAQSPAATRLPCLAAPQDPSRRQ